jgi:hypothetical protein
MAGYNFPTTSPGKLHVQKQTQLRCLQLNIEHCRLATDHLNKIIGEEITDILCSEEPYEFRNKLAGLSRRLKIFTAGVRKHRAAILVNNKRVDTVLLNQLSGENAVVIELIFDNKKAIISSMHFDINRNIDIDLRKIEAIIQHSHHAGILIAIDNNTRSSSWHDILTNGRGRILEKFLTSRQ